MSKEYSGEELEKRIGYIFHNKALLKQALTHSSFRNEQKINRRQDYERLEFLGDAVLELTTSDFLYHAYPDMAEGQMTKLRVTYVCEPALAYCAREIELDRFIRLGKGEENTGGRKRDSIISDVMEAVIGAIYLDGGMEEAKAFIHRFILSDLENKQLFYDSKTVLQEILQKQNAESISYELVDEIGPEHNKQFVVKAYIGEQFISKGIGKSKKMAEQQAAYEAILILKKEKD